MFNKKDFGIKIKVARKSRGLSQENLGKAIGKNATTIGRYESGEIMPDAEQISLICDELGIAEYELFDTSSKILNKENNRNPFNTNKLYLFYKAFYPKSNNYKKGKFRLDIIEKPDCCKVNFVDYKTNKIYLSGYMMSDSNVAIFIFENYKENNLRLEVSEIILNIARGTNTLMLGSFHCTNGNYEPSVRRCMIYTEDIDFSDEMYRKLEITDRELEELKAKSIWYVDVVDKYDFEDNI